MTSSMGNPSMGTVVAPLTQSPKVKANWNTGLYGTDLGISFTHNGRIEMLFGDTWTDACTDPAFYSNDDSQGRLKCDTKNGCMSPPDWVKAVYPPWYTGTALPLLDLDLQNTSQYAPITVTDNAYDPIPRASLSMGVGQTLIAGWSDGTHAYVAAQRNEQLSSLSGFSATCQAQNLTFINGVCSDPTSSNADKSAIFVEIAQRQNENLRTAYTVVGRFLTNKFMNLTAAEVDSYPNLNVQCPSGTACKYVVMFGRPRWITNHSLPNATAKSQSLPYMLYNLLPAPGQPFVWNPQFYTGLNRSNQPVWSTNQQAAAPLRGISTDFNNVNQFDVEYIAGIKRWVMLFGGDMSDMVDELAFNAAVPTADDSARQGAIHMRIAPNAWGPWSPAVPVLWREAVAQAGLFACDAPGAGTSYGQNQTWVTPNDAYYKQYYFNQLCTVGDPARLSNALSVLSPLVCAHSGTSGWASGTSYERGNLYGANIIRPWTQITSAPPLSTAKVFFNVSTWNPYEVVLAQVQIAVVP